MATAEFRADPAEGEPLMLRLVWPPRRFPPPWKAERIPGGYVVRDANGQAIAYVYAKMLEPEAVQAKVLTMDEARRVVASRVQSRCRGHSNLAQTAITGLFVAARLRHDAARSDG